MRTLVVLDSNTLCADYGLSSANFRHLTDATIHIGIHVYVPALVLDEVVNRFKEDVAQAREELRRAEQKLAKLSAMLKEPINAESDLRPLEDDYRVWLQNELEIRGFVILPYPTVSHAVVVARDLARQKPFKRNGSGYRDYLIWLTLLPLAVNAPKSQVAFISSNSSDFGENGDLASDLAADLEHPAEVVLYKSLRDFNDMNVVPHLETIDASRRITENQQTIANIRVWLEENVLDILRAEDDETMSQVLIGVDKGIGIYSSDLVSIDDVSIDRAVPSQGDSVIVRVRVRTTIRFSVDIDWENFLAFPAVRDYVGHTDEFSYSSESRNERVELMFDLTFEGESIVAGELWSISGSADSIEWLSSSSSLWKVITEGADSKESGGANDEKEDPQFEP